MQQDSIVPHDRSSKYVLFGVSASCAILIAVIIDLEVMPALPRVMLVLGLSIAALYTGFAATVTLPPSSNNNPGGNTDAHHPHHV